MSTWRGTGLGERAKAFQSAVDFSASSLPRGLFHSAEYQKHSGLIATTKQFQVSARHIQR